MTTHELDQDRAQAFAERMLAVLNDGALALMTSIGHRTAGRPRPLPARPSHSFVPSSDDSSQSRSNRGFPATVCTAH
jgi:hypothetical protein